MSNKLEDIQEHLQINGEPDATESDAVDYAIQRCGKLPDGTCLLAGSEECDFECPFWGE